MDIFDTSSGNGFVNPLNSHAPELAQPVIDDTVDIYTDDATGKRYSIDKLTGSSKWLDEDEDDHSLL